jgi:Single-strand binding protein family
MATFNQCFFIGRLGKDPEMSYTPTGKAVTKFSLAVDQGKDQKPMWLNIICWNELAERMNMRLYSDLRYREPGIKAKTKIMQSATDFHHLITCS